MDLWWILLSNNIPFFLQFQLFLMLLYFCTCGFLLFIAVGVVADNNKKSDLVIVMRHFFWCSCSSFWCCCFSFSLLCCWHSFLFYCLFSFFFLAICWLCKFNFDINPVSFFDVLLSGKFIIWKIIITIIFLLQQGTYLFGGIPLVEYFHHSTKKTIS